MREISKDLDLLHQTEFGQVKPWDQFEKICLGRMLALDIKLRDTCNVMQLKYKYDKSN